MVIKIPAARAEKGGSSQRGGPADPRGCYTGIVVALVKRSVLYALISLQVLMDHNLMELTDGKPLPLKFKANVRISKENSTMFDAKKSFCVHSFVFTRPF